RHDFSSINAILPKSISSAPTNPSHRAWLLQFFVAIERKEGREAIWVGLQETKKVFLPVTNK
ncbi:hypothetical protein DCC62_29310, partial [candidate division KSB1 bacterium]